ncbi:unnamed protein product [Parnassius apollo]|uniref:(apollo) hypothetical protein n=1 Tax=Parnassius apollo TaxID=110799 RepID=A0A8S3XQ58_PARAO|nr:unnamed protein product [Parnassius apollo]
MGLKRLLFVLFVASSAAAQNLKVCISTSNPVLCQGLDKDGSQAVCEPVESRVDCAIKLARNAADIGVFSEEEMMLLTQQQPNDNRVIATIKDVYRPVPYAFEAVAVVSSTHTGGLEGLRGGTYCHPGFDESEPRWSPRVLKTFERVVIRTDRCPGVEVDGKTAEELEVDALSKFFSNACRPGPWSANDTVDANLKSKYSSLCSLCGENNDCSKYTLNMGVEIAGVSNDNRHIQALECMRTNQNNSVAYVAWNHVREYFMTRNPQDAGQYSLLCEDGSLQALTADVLSSLSSPCAFVRQPWSAIVASAASAQAAQTSLRTWWPNGVNPGGNTWQSILFNGIIGGNNAVINFEDTLPSPANYTAQIRNITSIDAVASCLPARRWCTISDNEQTKCLWLRSAAYTLGIEPTISCQQRTNTFECLQDIKDNRADFIATPSNYGYISRQNYKLSALKLVQNTRSNPAAFSRVAALIKDSSQTEISRFENLRGKKACFPEFSGIAYMAFVNTAHERGVISASECDYARAVGEFFNGTCAPGALDASHSLTKASSFDSTTLCSVCKPAVAAANSSDFTCAWDYSNTYFGNNGSLACLADPETHVAFVEMQNIDALFVSLGLQPSQYRALCRNNTLAVNTGTNIDQGCLLAYVVDSEVLSRRNDPLQNSLIVLLDTLDEYFGYNAAAGSLINLEMYSPFDGKSDLLFKDTAIGLSEPSSDSANEAARNYIELFKHLDACTSLAPPAPAMASRNFYSLFTLFILTLLTRVVIY